MIKYIILISLLLATVISGCSPKDAPAVPQEISQPVVTTEVNMDETSTETQALIPPPTPTDTVIPTETSLPPLPADPQRVEFQSEDGKTLVGYYYPAAINPAPLIVLMHWGRGDQTDWIYVGMVSWLQNRGVPVPPPPTPLLFDTPYPFPPLPEDRSFAVFTFDFRGFGESKGNQFENFVLDASAAYKTAAGLEGIDPTRIAGIGGSVGANGAAGGCNEYCLAALSLGPQDFGGFNYAESVTAMGQLNKPAWCVAAEDMDVDLKACNSASGENYFMQIYPLGGHAMLLFREDLKLEPTIGTVIINFLDQALP